MKRIDCDVFMKDGSSLDLLDKVICITGNFYGSNDCYVTTAIIAGGDVIFENYANTVAICAGGNVSIGKYSKTRSICADEDVFVDDYSHTNHIFANKNVSLGNETCSLSVTAGGDIFSSGSYNKKTLFYELLESIENFLFRI